MKLKQLLNESTDSILVKKIRKIIGPGKTEYDRGIYSMSFNEESSKIEKVFNTMAKVSSKSKDWIDYKFEDFGNDVRLFLNEKQFIFTQKLVKNLCIKQTLLSNFNSKGFTIFPKQKNCFQK